MSLKVFFNFLFVILTISLLSDCFAAPRKSALSPLSKNAKSKITGGTPKAVQGGTLTYEFYEPNHINPITFRQAGSFEILTRWLFETLVDTDVVTGEDIPRIAKKWNISKNGKEFTFWIDKKAKWFDGKPITAEDVKFSFEVYQMPGVKSAFRKAQSKAFSKIEIINQKKLKFYTTERLFSNFEFLISTIIIPKHLYFYKDPVKMERNEFTRAPKGSGPYIFKEWKKGDHVTLERNPNYWGKFLPQNRGAYNFDKIVIKYIRDPQIAFEKIKKGELDYMPIRIGNSSLWRQTKTDKAFTSNKIHALAIRSKLQSGYGFIGFNLKNDLFKDKGVRVALTKAINRKEMIQKGLDGLAEIPLGPLYSAKNAKGSFKAVDYNPSEALKDLEQLGWRDSDGDYILDKNGKKFIFTVLVPNARIEKEMLFVQSYWKEIGVIAHIKILEYSTWRQLQDERKFDAISNGKNRTLLDRQVDPYSEWHSNNIPNGLRNYYGYSNPKVDKLIQTGRQEFNIHTRKNIFGEVNSILADSHVMLQYSESKYSLHAINSNIVMQNHNKNSWFPYALGMKYWYKKKL